MKAAMPIPYIIALIIGVIVVAVLAYWFISSGGKGTSIGKEAECTARKAEYCASQTNDALEKARTVCKELPSNWCDFCSFIPNWKSVSGVECPKKQS